MTRHPNRETPTEPGGRSAPEADQPPPLMPQIWWLLAVLMLVWLWSDAGQGDRNALPYSEFKELVGAGRIAKVTMKGDRVVATPQTEKAGQGTDKEPDSVVTHLPPVEDRELLPLLEKHGVELRVESAQGSWWSTALIAMLPWLLIIGLFWYTSRRMQERLGGVAGPGGLFGFGKSKARRFEKGESTVTFNDVAGLQHAKRDLAEISGYLRNPEQYRKLGAKIPRGILLMGSPGTGKTLLAKAVAGEADAPFFSISGSEFIEMFVGVGASRVRDLFESAKAEAPAIIFIDEIDSVGRARGTGLGGGHDEREQTLNQILNEMDGFAPHEIVVVMAATNRPDVLDPALLRPGRFDRKVTLDLPDRRARRAILDIHSRDVPLFTDADLDRVASLTVGFSGADLENLVNEAALLAGRESKASVDMAALLAARDKIVLGGRREMVLTEEEKRLIAFHEAGHAIVAGLLPNADPLDKVTIIPHGQALGATQQIPGDDRHNLRESYLRDRIGVMLGGRVAEQLIFGEVSSGSEEDLKQATHLARRMVTHWGMSPKLGPLAFRRGEEHIFLGREMTQQRDFSENTARIIDDEICNLVSEIENEVRDLLKDHRPQLEALAEALLESETLERLQIESVVEHAAHREKVYDTAADTDTRADGL